ncbi:MAG: hypothetical protein WAN12_18810 [Candidatus Acidiferrum sp.]
MLLPYPGFLRPPVELTMLFTLISGVRPGIGRPNFSRAFETICTTYIANLGEIVEKSASK